ncbi:glycosyltransferase [Marinibacterium profundimaris]|uniref:glycosyltransferase n=1 Tax=Marinibacterium profundimaris TaxID=1679460 RepID=UPI000B5253DA|nr:glycosyltransferase [Marinibacterium profundimaris]
MKILHLLASVRPESGGPVEYARVMAEEHQKAGHESAFVTLDPPDAAFISDFGFQVHGAGPRGKGGYTPRFNGEVARLAPDFDAAVVHGLWNHATVGGTRAMEAAGLPWVIFSHGMLDPYFRKIKPAKHLVKQGFWTLFQGRALSRAHAVLFTCEEERLLAQNAFAGHQDYNARVVAFCASQMGTGADAGQDDFLRQLPALSGRDYFLYLSRIHPKKACDQLIEAFAAVAQMDPGLDLVMAGPDQLGWVPELKALAEQLGVADRVHWPGMVKGAAREAAYSGARAFVLPSHQENFGLVVAEALSVGKPVLISTEVNIWREVVAAGAGLAVPDTTADTTRMLSDFLSRGEDEIAAMSRAARTCYENHFSVPQAAADLEAILLEAANVTPVRACPEPEKQ